MMPVGALSLNDSITVPGLGIKLNLMMLIDLLSLEFFGQRFNRDVACKEFGAYIQQGVLKQKLEDELFQIVEDQLGRQGINCNVDIAQLISKSISIGYGSDGVTVSVDWASTTREVAQIAACNLIKGITKVSGVLSPLITKLVSVITHELCPELATSTGVRVNDYSLPTPAPTAPPLAPPPSTMQSTIAPAPQATPWTPQVFPKPKTNYTPVIIVGGVALAVSAMILSRRR